MGIEDAGVIDAVGTEHSTGVEILTIVDAWDWSDERAHLLALQDKLNAYLEFIESGHLLEERPHAAGRPCRIDVLSRHPFPGHLVPFLEEARRVAATYGVELEQHDLGAIGNA